MPSVSPEEIQDALAYFQSYEKKLSKVLSIFVGECQFHDDKSVQYFMRNIVNASHCISIDFMDRQALTEFFDDPLMLEAKKKIVRITEGGYGAIVAFDLENAGI